MLSWKSHSGGGPWLQAKALRHEVSASDGTKHEVKALQRRLLAVQVNYTPNAPLMHP